MLVALVVVTALQTLVLVLGGALAVRGLVRAKNKLLAQARAFVTAPAEGQMSALAELTELVAARFGHQIVSQISAQAQASRSHVARQETALQQDMIVDTAAAQSPLLGLLATQFPSVTKRLAKNPSALPALMNLLSNLGSRSSGVQLALKDNGSHSPGPGGSVADRLRKQA